jgi:exosome complex component RRP4
MGKRRKIVLPSQVLGDIKFSKPGRGTFIENGKIVSEKLGILNITSNHINVIPLKGRYEPMVDDFVIGVVQEATPVGWSVDINAPYPAFLHVNEVPWEIEFGDTEKYLKKGDCIMAKVLLIDECKNLQITLNERGLSKIRGGYIIDVEPSRVPRIIGKKGSMISLIKKYIRCRIFVGQNGKIWIDGDTQSIDMALKAIRKIESESISYGLTSRIEEMLRRGQKEGL